MSNSHAACQCRQNHPNALIVWALWRFSIGTARVDGNVDATLKTWVDRPRSEPLDPLPGSALRLWTGAVCFSAGEAARVPKPTHQRRMGDDVLFISTGNHGRLTGVERCLPKHHGGMVVDGHCAANLRGIGWPAWMVATHG